MNLAIKPHEILVFELKEAVDHDKIDSETSIGKLPICMLFNVRIKLTPTNVEHVRQWMFDQGFEIVDGNCCSSGPHGQMQAIVEYNKKCDKTEGDDWYFAFLRFKQHSAIPKPKPIPKKEEIKKK
jgi:hypothetical protein